MQVAVCTPSLALGYFNDYEREKATFITVSEDKPCPAHITPALPAVDFGYDNNETRWYLTGDLAMIDNTGMLTLLDRVCASFATAVWTDLYRSGECVYMYSQWCGSQTWSA